MIPWGYFLMHPPGEQQSFLNALLKMTFLFANGDVLVPKSEKLSLFVHRKKITIRSNHSQSKEIHLCRLRKHAQVAWALWRAQVEQSDGSKTSQLISKTTAIKTELPKNYYKSEAELVNTPGNEDRPYKIKTQSFWGVTTHLSIWGVASRNCDVFRAAAIGKGIATESGMVMFFNQVQLAKAQSPISVIAPAMVTLSKNPQSQKVPRWMIVTRSGTATFSKQLQFVKGPATNLSQRIRNGDQRGAVSNLRHSTSNGDAFQRSSILQRQSYQSQEWQWCLTICKSNWPGPCPQSKWRLQAWWLFPKKCNLERPTPEW